MKKYNYPGKFIVIEGLDGSGKTSQVKLLVNFLKKKGKDVISTKEPTVDSRAGKDITAVLRGEIKMEPLELQKLFWQDRKEHLENKVTPALKSGKIVVSSRYTFSSFAYGSNEGLDLNLLIEMNKDFLLPDLTIIVDVLPENCIKRIENRGEPKKYFEKIEKLKRVNEVYKKMPETFDNVFIINGEKPILEVFGDIKKEVEKIL